MRLTFVLISVCGWILSGCATSYQPKGTEPSQATSSKSHEALAESNAAGTEEFDRIQTIFLEQCLYRSADPLEAQIQCARKKYKEKTPFLPSLRLFDNVYTRFVDGPHSRSDSEERVEFAELLRRVQKALESGDTVDESLDQIMEKASILGARESQVVLGARESGAATPVGSNVIQLRNEHGTYVVSGSLNAQITLDFTLDSGASDVTLPADVALTLMRTGTLQQQDFVDRQIYQLADGSRLPSQRVRIRVLKIGSVEMRDVLASIVPPNADLLLGQSFLARLKSWTLDNGRPALIVVQ